MKPLPSASECACWELEQINRRHFLKAGAAGLAAMGASLPVMGTAAPIKKSESETLVTTLHKSLTEEQKKLVAFPFDHPLRSKVDNSWLITKQTISEFYTPDQQAMIREIFMGLHSSEYAESVMKQVEHDNGNGGFGKCSIALFGTPGTGKFEFVLSGRHVTRRCDGDSVEGEAFGGPIFYGHAAEADEEKPDHPGNAYWYQAKRANEVFQMLDGKQREVALLGQSRAEKGTDTVKLTGKKEGLPGIPIGTLSRDQKEQVRKVMSDVLAPFRKRDVDEALKMVDGAGFENLHMAFYKNEDVGNDGVWDVWQIEGPAMLWYFRGDPHVHTWVHIRDKAEIA